MSEAKQGKVVLFGVATRSLGTFWRVEVSESCDSSGGEIVFYALTGGGTTLPDVQAAFRALRHRDSCEIYDILSITQVNADEVGIETNGALLDDIHDQR